GRKNVQKMYALPYHRRSRQKRDRPNPKRPERTQVRFDARLQLLGCEQKFRDCLGRSDLQGIHQRSQGEDSGHQNGVSGDQGREGGRRFVELPRAVRTGRQEEMSNSAVVAQKSPKISLLLERIVLWGASLP